MSYTFRSKPFLTGLPCHTQNKPDMLTANIQPMEIQSSQYPTISMQSSYLYLFFRMKFYFICSWRSLKILKAKELQAAPNYAQTMLRTQLNSSARNYTAHVLLYHAVTFFRVDRFGHKFFPNFKTQNGGSQHAYHYDMRNTLQGSVASHHRPQEHAVRAERQQRSR